jgi:hypothetical protein
MRCISSAILAAIIGVSGTVIVGFAGFGGKRLEREKDESSTEGEASAMTEEDARLALLQAELSSVESSIRSLDAIDFQIKGWCVTASLAIGGFAVAYHKAALIVVAVGAVIGFFLVNSQFKRVQRVFIRRNRALDAELKTFGIMEVLAGRGSLQITGAAAPQWRTRPVGSWWDGLKYEVAVVLHEGRQPNTFGLYLFILVCLIIEGIILALSEPCDNFGASLLSVT